MVVSESGILAAMRDAFKGAGYKVANDDSGGTEQIMIGAPGWVVVMEKKNIPRKVLGLIAEHVGDIPEPGQAYQVSKKQTQTEVFSMSMQLLTGMKNEEKERRLCKKTSVVLDGFPLWQRDKDLKMVRVPAERERIMLSTGRDIWLFDSDTLMVDGKASRVYIDTFKAMEDGNVLDHLAKVKWVSFNK